MRPFCGATMIHSLSNPGFVWPIDPFTREPARAVGYHRIKETYTDVAVSIKHSFVYDVLDRGESEARHAEFVYQRAREKLKWRVIALGATHLLTLTYRENVEDLAQSREHLTTFWRLVKKYVPGFKFVAVAELQISTNSSTFGRSSNETSSVSSALPVCRGKTQPQAVQTLAWMGLIIKHDLQTFMGATPSLGAGGVPSRLNSTGDSQRPCRRTFPPKSKTQKPVELLERLIEIFTDEGDVVIDPCAGSGSTLIAAQRKSRKGYGFEIKKEFFVKAQNWIETDFNTFEEIKTLGYAKSKLEAEAPTLFSTL